MSELNWQKSDGLVPAIVQDADTQRVLMLGYMNQESLTKTRETGKVTFYSRSRQSIWTKGETSGNGLNVVEILPDCDQDTLLIRARPEGPTCHRGTETCFDGELSSLLALEQTISERLQKKPKGSYVAQLAERGLDRIIQKVGEEAVETVIAAKNTDLASLESEAADLLFHLLVLLQSKGSGLSKIAAELKRREK